MGNCIVSSHGHERLNESHYNYFEKSQSISSHSSKRRSWRKRASVLSKLDTPILTEFDQQDEEATVLESPYSVTTIVAESTPSSIPQQIDGQYKQQQLRREFCQEKGWDDSKHLNDPHDPWKDRNRGGALELRLAKNRYLQLVSSALESQESNAAALDLSTRSQRYFDPNVPNEKETMNSEFQNEISQGVIWEEVVRPKTVAAIAMSRDDTIFEDDTMFEESSSLLCAIGTEDGVLTLIEIQDNSMNGGETNTEGQSDRNFGAQVELPLVGRIRAIDFSPDGQYLVAGGDGCIAYLIGMVRNESTFALKDMRLLRQIERVDRIYTVRFSPDSQSVAFGGFDGKIATGSVSSILQKERPLLQEVPMSGLVLCMDWIDNLLAVGTSGDNGFAVIDSSNNMTSHFFSRPSGVETMKWKPDNAMLAIGDRDMIVYDSQSFDVKYKLSDSLLTHDTTSHKYRVSSLCWSPDGSFLAIGGSDGICFVLETSGFTLVHQIQRPCRIVSLAWGQQRMLNGDCRRYLGISDDSCKVAMLKAGIEPDDSVFEDGGAPHGDWILREGSFSDIEDKAPQRLPRSKAEGTITAIAFSRRTKSRSSVYLAYASEDCTLTILSTQDWNPVLQMDFLEPLRSLSFSYSNNYLAIGGDEGVLFVLSVPTRSVVLNMIYDSPIETVAFSRQDKRLSVGLHDGVLSLLSPRDDWKSCGEIDYSESTILCQDWSSNFLAIGRTDGSVAVFDESKALDGFFVPVAEFSGESAPIRSVAFGTGGRNLVFGGDTGTVSIANRLDGWACSKLKLKKSVLAAKWSPGGRYIVFTGAKQTIRMIDTLTGEEVEEIQETAQEIFEANAANNFTTVDFSADGKLIAFGCSDGGMHILNSTDWKAACPPID